MEKVPEWMEEIVNEVRKRVFKEHHEDAKFNDESVKNLIEGRAVVVLLEDKSGRRIGVTTGPSDICVKMLLDTMEKPEVKEVVEKLLRERILKDIAERFGGEVTVFSGDDILGALKKVLVIDNPNNKPYETTN